MRRTPALAAAAAIILALGALPSALRAQDGKPLEGPDDQKPLSREERNRLYDERVRAIIEQRKREAKEREAKMQAAGEANRGNADVVSGNVQQQPGATGAIVTQLPGATDAANVRPPGQPAVATASQAARLTSAVLLYYAFPTRDGGNELDTTVRVGQEFASEIRLFNEIEADITAINIALTYDRRFVEPIRLFDSELRPGAESAPTFSDDPREGIVRYSIRLNQPFTAKEGIPLRVIWRALRPTTYTGLGFAFEPGDEAAGTMTGVFAGERNVLGVASDPLDGVLGGGVTIDTAAGREQRLQGKESDLREMYLGTVGAHASAGLVLKAHDDAGDIRVGDVFGIDLTLNNPEGTLVDSIDAMLQFDPTVLEAVDMDRGNWIRRGINAYDGAYRRQFPFTTQKWNEARNDRGTLRYSVAMNEGRQLPTGTFATIYFRARRPVADTRVTLLRQRPGENNLTSVRYFGFEVGGLSGPLSVPELSVAVGPAAEGDEPRDARDEHGGAVTEGELRAARRTLQSR